MSHQPSLFLELRRARRTDPATSHAAAAQTDFYLDHFRRITEALQDPGTIYEIADRTGLTHVQVARRTPEMQEEGLIRVRPGETRPSPSGRACRVWERV